MDGVLLQTAEALGDASFVGPGEMWEVLQAEKENVEGDIISTRVLRQDDDAIGIDVEPTEESAREVEWHRCETLEDRLRALNDAQDRLMDGGYGLCLECGQQIDTRRLCADPAASLCVTCQRQDEGELSVRTL
jgi:DnaK suppressor protein